MPLMLPQELRSQGGLMARAAQAVHAECQASDTVCLGTVRPALTGGPAAQSCVPPRAGSL